MVHDIWSTNLDGIVLELSGIPNPAADEVGPFRPHDSQGAQLSRVAHHCHVFPGWCFEVSERNDRFEAQCLPPTQGLFALAGVSLLT